MKRLEGALDMQRLSNECTAQASWIFESMARFICVLKRSKHAQLYKGREQSLASIITINSSNYLTALSSARAPSTTQSHSTMYGVDEHVMSMIKSVDFLVEGKAHRNVIMYIVACVR